MTTPLKELLETGAGLHPEEVPYEMARRLRKLDELHSRVHRPNSPHMKVPYCSQCGDEWPCDTRRILDGKE